MVYKAKRQVGRSIFVTLVERSGDEWVRILTCASFYLAVRFIACDGPRNKMKDHIAYAMFDFWGEWGGISCHSVDEGI